MYLTLTVGVWDCGSTNNLYTNLIFTFQGLRGCGTAGALNKIIIIKIMMMMMMIILFITYGTAGALNKITIITNIQVFSIIKLDCGTSGAVFQVRHIVVRVFCNHSSKQSGY